MCGGTRRRPRFLQRAGGLSPRVRGNRRGGHGRADGDGSIPACAGEPSSSSSRMIGARVYPRVCGGTVNLLSIWARTPGLSPRVRGNRRFDSANDGVLGSIPACAGEPVNNVALFRDAGVYPRVCGGTNKRMAGHALCAGLSPRVRGNRLVGEAASRRDGSIPACAGEPGPAGRRTPTARVYPRVCGGTLVGAFTPENSTGLSPRVRGNLQEIANPRLAEGSIPACAGEPPSPSSAGDRSGVYPRVCGGTWSSVMPAAASRGLSPRVRGNQAKGLPAGRGIGSIPACAGEPRS